MKLDKEQTAFVDEVVNGNGHIILTGKAGTGKSVSLASAVKAAQAAGMNVMVMAPTAMAASIHRDAGLESGTIHHALKWNPQYEPLGRKLLSVCSSDVDWHAVPDNDRLLFVDEASMVGLWMFDILLRDLGEGKRPFDGRRVILVGDWAQLPPVVTNEDKAGMCAEFSSFGPPDGCLLYHRIWGVSRPTAIVLTQTHRANGEWFEALNRVRDCSSRSSLAHLGVNPELYHEPVTGLTHDLTHLCYRRSSAQTRNAQCLARLPGREITLPLRDGNIALKPGCDVIVTSNRAGGNYINGSRAVFQGMGQSGELLLDDGQPVMMLAEGNWGRGGGRENANFDEDKARHGSTLALSMLSRYGKLLDKDALKWLEGVAAMRDGRAAEKFGDGRTVFRPYFPVLPGYALTVHKAQGSTLTGVAIEDDVFWNLAPFRLPYVALSRVSDVSSIRLAGVFPRSVYVRPDPAYAGITARIASWQK